MRNLCEYQLNTDRLCKNYKFNDKHCYIHDYTNSFTLVIYVLFDLIIFLFIPIALVFNLFLFVNYYIINYLEELSLYNEIFQDDLFM
jgi:hypothetical protein